MKIIQVNFSGSKGGAAIAAGRLHTALRRNGMDSIFWCARHPFVDAGAVCVKNRLWQKVDGLKNVVVQRFMRWIGVVTGRSINMFPSRLVRQLNASDADVIHLHWINAEMVSIEQLAKLNKPVVWTLHDMWAFCGAEHYTESERYISGYTRGSFDPLDSGSKLRIDLDRGVFCRKQKYWRDWHPHIVTPSQWLGDCARKSKLLGHLNSVTIPNCLDLDLFRPLGSSSELKAKYGLPQNKKIILFGAFSTKDQRKGGDLLEKALRLLLNKHEYAVAVFGTSKIDPLVGDVEAYALGSISGDVALAEIYNMADVMCVPSRQDNLPNTAVEACACGVPVVAFDKGGLSDIVDHKLNGYLAEPFDAEDFARGIVWVLDQADHLRQHARNKALTTYSESVVARQYMEVYKQVSVG
jgi:glycosyltransferase involved in cell wall biosynthesis